MYHKLINFIEASSNAILNTIDKHDCITDDGDGKYILNLDKKTQEVLEFYINDYILNEHYFGKKNIVINTCRPFDNWRKKQRGCSVRGAKYTLSDSSVITDKQKLEYFLDKCWDNLKKQKREFILVSNNSLDIFDLTYVIEKIIGIDCTYKQPHYYILKDGNVDEYLHDNSNINNSLINELESMLRDNSLII